MPADWGCDLLLAGEGTVSGDMVFRADHLAPVLDELRSARLCRREGGRVFIFAQCGIGTWTPALTSRTGCWTQMRQPKLGCGILDVAEGRE